MSDYRVMWEQMGLDLDAHDGLMNVLGGAYGSIYMDQKNRPQAMGYFDTVMSSIHGFRVQELLEAKAQGRKVIGSFCVFVPEELILAVDAIHVGLCAGAELGSDLAEQYVPRNTCALIKSMFGFKLSKVCPFMEVTDMIVGENTCDGKKKAYEQFAKIQSGFYLMDLPQVKSASGRELLRAEYLRFAEALEQLTGNKITAEKLKAATEIVNAKRKAMSRLSKLRAANPAPISGLDVLLANQIYFFDNPVRFTQSINELCDELEIRIRESNGVAPASTARILISGCPMALPNWKLPAIIESSNAVIIGEETCTGERGTQNLTNTNASTVEGLIDAIVDRYLTIDCAIFTPNPTRMDHIKQMAKEYQADGVIYYSLQFCQPYSHEAISTTQELEQAGIPVLSIETDYSQEDLGQLKTRIEAFVERIQR